ncbi:flagellar hook-length control protein FliK [Sphingomonas qilianensis]|uniref:Flagellar hook-length control protein FliK n=1 Tax=Sphingomonas qilianensis TaxID=1736690 RepID=A0ABU9XRL5_9SPHN
MKIASQIVGPVAPVSAGGATTPGAIAFGALLTLGGNVAPPTLPPATAAPAAVAPAVTPEMLPPAAALPRLATGLEGAEIAIAPDGSEAPGAVAAVAAPVMPAPTSNGTLPQSSVAFAAAELASSPLPLRVGMSVGKSVGMSIGAPVASAMEPLAPAPPKSEYSAKSDTEEPAATDQGIPPSSPPPVMLAPPMPANAPAVTTAATTNDMTTMPGAVAPAHSRPAGEIASDTVLADGNGVANLAASDGAFAQQAVAAPRTHAFTELYKHHAVNAAADAVVAAQPGSIGREMGVAIARHVAAGRDEMMVRLDPPDMGRIDIRLSFDREGGVRGVIAADHQGALDLLRRETGDLSRALADAGIRADAQSFRFDSRARDFGQQQQQPRQDPGDLRNGAAQPDSGPLDQPVYRTLRASGRIDLMA